GSFNYVSKTIDFPAGGGIFPFMLAASQNGSSSGLELAWADPGSDSTFALIPMTSMYSPDVHAPLAVAGPLVAGGQVTFTSTVSNQGTAPAFPGNPADGGLLFTLALPLSAFV